MLDLGFEICLRFRFYEMLHRPSGRVCVGWGTGVGEYCEVGGVETGMCHIFVTLHHLLE